MGMGNDKEEENTWFEIGFEDESWKQEKTSPTLQAMRTQMQEDKQEKSAIERAEREAAVVRGYYSLVMASNIVAGLPESTTLRTSLPSYLTWARAISARKREWLVSGGLTRPKDDFPIPVRQAHCEEESLVYLSDFIEWAIEVGCTVAPSAVEEARRECEVTDSFDRRVRLWEIERTRAELAGAKTEEPEVILAREARLAALERERVEIVLSLNGDQSETERIGSPSHIARSNADRLPNGKPCIRRSPETKDDWYLVIRDAANAFHDKYGRCPNKAEMWAWLNSFPPPGYSITRGKDKGGEKALLGSDGSSLAKRAFEARWGRYTPDTRKHQET